jgi:hypothetical protein
MLKNQELKSSDLIAESGRRENALICATRYLTISAAPFKREHFTAEFYEHKSVLDLVIDNIPQDYWAFAQVYINDAKVPNPYWARVYPLPGTITTINVIPQGGDDKNPIALLVGALTLGAGAAFGAHVAAGGTFLGLSGTAALVAGNLAIGYAGYLANKHFVKPPNQRLPSVSQDTPIQSITGVSNRANPFGAIPVIFGKTKMYPPLAVKPFTEIIDNEQYLRMLFAIGYQDSTHNLSISDIKIGNTAITNYSEFEMEYTTPFASLTQAEQDRWFPNISEESLSSALTQAAGWITQTTTASTTGILVDITFPALVAFSTSDGTKSPVIVDFEIEYKPNGGATWYPMSKHTGDPQIVSNKMGTARNGHSATNVGGIVYVVGGTTVNGGTTYLDTIEAFDPSTETWTTKSATLTTARRYQAAVAVGTDIFLFGGETAGGTILDSVEIYDTVGDSISAGATMPDALSKMEGIYFQKPTKVILVYGGWDGAVATSELYEYGIVADTWGTGTLNKVTGPNIATLKKRFGYALIPPTISGIVQRVWFMMAGGETAAGTETDDILYVVATFTSGAPLYHVVGDFYTLPEPRTMHSVAFDNTDPSFAYMGGGLSGGVASDAFYKIRKLVPFDTIALDTLSAPQAEIRLASADGKVYPIGGLVSGLSVTDIERFSSTKKTITAASTQVVRRTFSMHGLTSDTYDVRIKRTTADNSATEVSDDATWTALRSVRAGSAVTNTNIRTLALRIKASDQLNGVIDQLNCIVEAEVPTHDGVEWSQNVSRNPAWAYAQVLRGGAAKNSMADARLNITQIKSWADFCDTNGYKFDFVVEGAMRQADLLDLIASTGRASRGMVDDLHSVIQDDTQATPVQMFGPRNILAGSFKGGMTYRLVPHGLKIRFRNEDENYLEEIRTVYRDGFNADGSGGNATATVFEDMEFPGVVSSDNVFRLARYFLAVGVLRPEVWTFKCSLDALSANRGDRVKLQHDASSIGLGSARISAVGTSGGQIVSITLDRAVQTSSGTNYTISVRKSGGGIVSRVVTVAATQENTFFTITTPADSTGDYDAGDFAMIGTEDAEAVDAVISSIRYTGDFVAEVGCVPYDTGVYTADTEAIPAYTTTITLTPEQVRKIPDDPTIDSIVSDEFALERTGDGSLDSGAILYLNPFVTQGVAPSHIGARHRRTDSTDGPYTHAPPVSAEQNQIRIGALEDGVEYTLQVRYISKVGETSEWVSTTHTVQGKQNPPPDVANLTATVRDRDLLLSWDKVTVPDLWKYEIREGASWAAGTVIDVIDTTTQIIDALTAASYTYRVKAIDTTGNYSTTEDTVSITIAALSAPGNLGAQSAQGRVSLSWEVPTFSGTRVEHGVRYYNIYRGASGSDFADSTRIGTIGATEYDYTEKTGGTYKYFVTAYDFGGNESTAATYEIIVDDAFEYVLLDTVRVTPSLSGTAFDEDWHSPIRYYLGADSTSWVDVHTANGWTSVQDQIDSGNTYFIEPLVSNDTAAGRFTMATVSWAVGLRNIKAKLLFNQTDVDTGALDIRVRFATDNGTVVQNQPDHEFFADQVDSFSFYVEFYGDANSLSYFDTIQYQYWAMKRTFSGSLSVTTAPTGTALDIDASLTAWPDITANVVDGATGDTVKIVQNIAYDEFTLYTYDSGGSQVARTVNWQARGY